MKTPEEIKNALNNCGGSGGCKGCPYYVGVELCIGMIMDDALAYIQQLENQIADIGKKVPKWISPDDELPEEYVSVLGCMGDAGFLSVHECYLTGSGFLFPALGEYRPVKYWACMPEPPKEEHHD